MPKKINYAAMYTLRADGRYQGYYRDAAGKRHAVCDRDPEQLHRKLVEREAPPALRFRDLAEFWYDSVWARYKEGTQSAYHAAYERALEEFGDWEAAEINASDIFAHLERMKNERRSARTVKAQRTLYKLIYQAAITDKELGSQLPAPEGLAETQNQAGSGG